MINQLVVFLINSQWQIYHAYLGQFGLVVGCNLCEVKGKKMEVGVNKMGGKFWVEVGDKFFLILLENIIHFHSKEIFEPMYWILHIFSRLIMTIRLTYTNNNYWLCRCSFQSTNWIHFLHYLLPMQFLAEILFSHNPFQLDLNCLLKMCE